MFTYAPTVRAVSGAGGVVAARPAVGVSKTGGRVAYWNGDDAVFTLQGLQLARVNDDLAESLGRGSERGFLVLDTGDSWSGLRSGDVLIGVDGHPVQDGRAARIALGASEDHSAEVIRDGRRRIVPVTVR
jgi:hypothetical protein